MAIATLQNRFFTTALIAISVLAFFIFRPYLGAIVLGATFAVIFLPLNRRIRTLTGHRRNIAAAVTTLLVLLVVFVPLLFFGIQIIREAQSLYLFAIDPDHNISNSVGHLIEEQVKTVAPGFTLDLDLYAVQASQWLLQHIGPAFSSAAKIVINLLLSLLILFYLFRDGERLLNKIISLSPLPDAHDQHIVLRLKAAINSVIRGSLVIALMQGVSTGLGFAIFGVPSAALWGSVAVLAALIPNIGTALVITPAILYLFLSQQLTAAIGLVIWGVLAVGLIDNLLGPILINRGIRLHPMIVLLAVIGGLQFFGPIGYILGPLVASLLVTLLDLYPTLLPATPTAPTKPAA